MCEATENRLVYCLYCTCFIFLRLAVDSKIPGLVSQVSAFLPGISSMYTVQFSFFFSSSPRALGARLCQGGKHKANRSTYYTSYMAPRNIPSILVYIYIYIYIHTYKYTYIYYLYLHNIYIYKYIYSICKPRSSPLNTFTHLHTGVHHNSKALTRDRGHTPPETIYCEKNW